MAKHEQSRKPGAYDFSAIERRWQAYWEKHATFRTINPGDPGADPSRPKYYILDFFPYPSGAGLHVGHPLGYCATDIISRYKRMQGFNVLHPMGFDAFGLPAEQYAIETNVHPAITTKRNIDTYRRQLKMFGFSYDWDREISTCEPDYYKFTQWIFLQLFDAWYDDTCAWTGYDGRAELGRARPIAELIERWASGTWGVSLSLQVVRERDAAGRREWADLSSQEQRKAIDNHRLAYLDEVAVNWCPALGTVLSNEEVDADGRSDRANHKVYRKALRQWMLRITKYADRLLSDLDSLDWPDPIKLMQRNWIGRSSGAEVVFPLADWWSMVDGQWRCSDDSVAPGEPLSCDSFPHAIHVYTTRPDTLFGATYMVLAPEHPLVEEITTPERQAEVTAYVAAARHRSDRERTTDAKEKTGVFTGAHAVNPASGASVPIWVADYVLLGYGTGAIMAVPGHDTRDFQFAKTFDLPIIAVVQPDDAWFHQQVGAGAIDGDYCKTHGKGELAETLMESASAAAGTRGGITAQNATAILDGDPGWVRQVLLPAFADDPGILCESFVGEGRGLNSPNKLSAESLPADVCDLNGLETAEAKAKITAWLEAKGAGRAAVNYKLRDWVFSRQKYWGEPFPVLHREDGETVAVDAGELPVELPPMEDFKPVPLPDDPDTAPSPPLGRAKEWATFSRDGQRLQRDLNTMPQWAGSCWYYLRFMDPRNKQRFCNAEAERYWSPVDLYVGGAEHAVLHLLYARFWHKVLYDLGHVSKPEPFAKLFNQGMIQSFAFRDARGVVVGPDQVVEASEDKFVLEKTGQPVTRIIAKMSKALKNVVNPDEIIAEYGADTFRLYEMYMGPLEASKPWNTRDVPGLAKLCRRIWRLVVDEYTDKLSSALTDDEPDEAALRVLHKTIKRVGEDIEALKFNTAITALFDFVNALTPMARRPRGVIEPFVLLVSPFAPHLGEELWHRLGHDKSLAFEPWPVFDERYIRQDEVEVAVQVLGKIKARIMVAVDADDEAVKEVALANERVAAALAGKTVRKVIVVKGRLVNIIAH